MNVTDNGLTEDKLAPVLTKPLANNDLADN